MRGFGFRRPDRVRILPDHDLAFGKLRLMDAYGLENDRSHRHIEARIMPIAKLEGVDLFYEDQGEGSPLVFLHGGGGSHRNWANQLPVFGADYRMVLLDQRGFGQSVPRDLDTLGDTPLLGRDLAQLLELLGIENDIVLVGHSLGTHPALDFTERHPERVKGLVLSSAFGGLTNDYLASCESERIETLREAQRRLNARAEANRIEGEPAGAGVTGAGGNRENLIDALVAVGSRSTRPSIADLRRFLETTRPIDAVTAARIDVPVLMLAGERDYIAIDEFEAAAGLLPRAELAVIAGAAHAGYQEAPAAFNTLLDRFLSRLG